MLKLKNTIGQSTVEYILLVTAVVAVMIVFSTNKDTGLRANMNSTLSGTAAGMTNLADRLKSSRPSS